HVLEADAPHPFVKADRVQKMDMRASQSRGVRASETFYLHLPGEFFLLQPRKTAIATAQIYLALGEPAQHIHATDQILTVLARYQLGLHGQRVGVHQVNEN